MEAESVSSFSPLLQAADQWGELLVLLPLLVALEAVLSADNAIALAAISRRLHDPVRQRQALNLGLALALVFRIALILTAQVVLHVWPLQLLASAYLLWLCGRQLLQPDTPDDLEADRQQLAQSTTPTPLDPQGLVTATAEATPGGSGPAGQAPAPRADSPLRALGGVVVTLALTDLAFSLDSVAAAVAVTDRVALVIAGGVLGVIALRLTAELFIRWLEVYSRLETAGYLAVGLIGLRLLLRLTWPALPQPEWLVLVLVSGLFLWGFSRRQPEEEASR